MNEEVLKKCCFISFKERRYVVKKKDEVAFENRLRITF